MTMGADLPERPALSLLPLDEMVLDQGRIARLRRAGESRQISVTIAERPAA